MREVEINITPTSLNVIKQLDFVDMFIVGERKYGLRMPYYFSIDEIKEIISIAKCRNQKVAVAVNKIIHEDELPEVEHYLRDLKKLNPDGILFGDLSIFQLAKKYNIVDLLIYNPETYLTNDQTVSLYVQKGIKKVMLAKEIPLEDIKYIGNRKLCHIEVLGHGALNMFHSKRNLVTNYFKYLDKEGNYRHQPLYMIEEMRNDQYPIIEDEHGTHVYSSHDLCTINYLDVLIENHISSIRIDGMFKDDESLIKIAAIYKDAILDYHKDTKIYSNNKEDYINRLNTIPNIRSFNEGFLFKKTIYKGD